MESTLTYRKKYDFCEIFGENTVCACLLRLNLSVMIGHGVLVSLRMKGLWGRDAIESEVCRAKQSMVLPIPSVHQIMARAVRTGE